jgi:iron(III) transport system substrate-binding protein
MKKSKIAIASVMSALVVSLLTAIAPSANAIAGNICTQEGRMISKNGVTYLCVNKGGKLTYDAGRKLSGNLNVVCGATEAWCVAMTSNFQKLTGVNTKFVRLSSGLVPARLEAFKTNPEFDAWHGGPADGHGVGKINGLTDKYLSPTLRMINKATYDAEGYWSGVYRGALGFCSNRESLRKLGVKAPRSWADLLDSRLKGQVLSAHPATSGTAFTTFWTQVERLGSEDRALAYMKDFNKNILYYSRSGVAPVAAAGRGEVAVGLVFAHDCVAGIEQGFPLVNTFPSEGTGYEIGAVSLVKGAKNLENAKAYIDFTLSAQAQNLGAGVAAYQELTNPKAKSDRRIIKLSRVKLVDYDFVKAAERKEALTAKFDLEVVNRSAARG